MISRLTLRVSSAPTSESKFALGRPVNAPRVGLGNQISSSVVPDKVAIPWPDASPTGISFDEDMREA
jgi:hypothetical protein